jgi:hypothetical protein
MHELVYLSRYVLIDLSNYQFIVYLFIIVYLVMYVTTIINYMSMYTHRHTASHHFTLFSDSEALGFKGVSSWENYKV